MLKENLSNRELIIYLFKAKKWTGSDAIWKVWEDMLSEFDSSIVKYAVIKGIQHDGHLDASLLRRWCVDKSAYINRDLSQQKMIPQYKFCNWCLEKQSFDTTYEDHYCTKCSSRYIKEKSDKAEELKKSGKLDFVIKCRDHILNNVFNFDKKEKYVEKLLEIRGKDKDYAHIY